MKYWSARSRRNPTASDFPVRPNSFDRTLATNATTPAIEINSDVKTNGLVNAHRSPWSYSHFTEACGFFHSIDSVVRNLRAFSWRSDGFMALFTFAWTSSYRSTRKFSL